MAKVVKRTDMNETLLDDALLMREATSGDAELLAVDLWLHDTFGQMREREDTAFLARNFELPQ